MELDREFVVEILYREPSYEIRIEPKKNPYKGTYNIRAKNKEEAEEMAMNLFRSTEKRSLVGWTRVVQQIEVNEVPEF